jgi:hypothetical protein
MMNKNAVLLLALLTGVAPISSFADKLGDPAPPLTVREWIKDRPAATKPRTNIYVLVFGSLCRASDFALTNLSHLQRKYRDKGVLAVAISDEPAEQLKAFVQLKGSNIEYAVAADNNRKTTSAYLRAFQQLKLPRAFVVGYDGKVLWYGHPMGGLDQIVDKITSGQYDFGQTERNLAETEDLETYLALASKDAAQAQAVGRKLLSLRTNNAAGLCDLAFRIAVDPFLEKRDVALANAALDRALQLSPTNAASVAVNRAILLFQTGRQAEGLDRLRQAQAAAQSQEDLELIRSNLRAMELQLAAQKASQTNAPARKP